MAAATYKPTAGPTQLKNSISSMEGTLLDLKTLIRFGLHMTENSTEAEFGDYKGDWCTLMYLLLDKIGQMDEANGKADFAAREWLAGEEARH